MTDHKTLTAATTLHLVLNDFPPDYRVLKEGTALAKAGWQVTIFAMGGKNLPQYEQIDGVEVERMPLRSRAWKLGKVGILFKFTECMFRMLIRGRAIRPAVVHAHDLSALPIGWLIAKLTKSKLLYDSHEYWADSSHRTHFGQFFYYFYSKMEKFLIIKTDGTITVSNGIADLIRKDASNHIRVDVVRNTPHSSYRNDFFNLKKDLSIPYNSIVFIFIGGILKNRGVEDIIEAFSKTNDGSYLVFLGSHALPDWLQNKVTPEILERIRFKPPVPPAQVASWASGADVGLIATRGSNLSHQHSLPNKIFESIQAGLAVIAPNLPEMANLIREYRCGRTFIDGDVLGLSEAMNDLANAPEELSHMKSAAVEASRELVWEKEQRRLLEVYDRLVRPT